MTILPVGAIFMKNNIYLALYKGNREGKGFEVLKAKIGDYLTRKLTRGKYSHCEIAVKVKVDSPYYCCYSSSIRDKGVRCKMIALNDKWDLIPLNITENEVRFFFNKVKGKKYDFIGALGVVFKTKDRSDRYFCSEFAAELLGLKEAWRFSPNDLAAIFGKNA